MQLSKTQNNSGVVTSGKQKFNLHSGIFLMFLILNIFPFQAKANLNSTQDSPDNYITLLKSEAGFVIAEAGKTSSLVIDANEFQGVRRIAGYLQEDIRKVTGTKPELIVGKIPSSGEIIIAGTLGKSSLITRLVKAKKIDVSEIQGKWETTLTEVVENPFPGIKKALVIVGSDKRGTIYGLLDLSRNMGVSPWYFWSDVPVQVQKSIYAKAGRFVSGEPKVKYRGIFLNDEEPALGRWAVKNYGGFNHEFYEKVFELILRLKGNYLWPAMWWASFNTDDPVNPELADEMGIVMSTTHHEPMMRAHAEWKLKKGAVWNYETNADTLKQFWKEGIQRMGKHESIVSMGMRGDGDMAMSAETNIALLEKIVADQRKIIAAVTKKQVEKTPQLWALYKEVQDYYDNGMRVPDDVTLLLCDDNWGNIRKLPRIDALPRSGGYGIYYHFDYVGGPRNYKWLNTSPLPRVWEQMHMAYEYGVDRIWLVNVGDLKPMELPISFFLDYAWNPDVWPAERLPEYTVQWAAEQFGNENAPEIAEILRLYTKYNGRRKPELLSPETYSLNNFREAEIIVEDYNRLASRAEALRSKIPVIQRDAYYELVLHPVTACANLNELYFAAAKNKQAVAQGRATANDWADKVKELFRKDAEITNYYHTVLAGGKWDHMMAQTHIGYTYWQQPPVNKMPEVKEISLPDLAEMGISVEGSDSSWTEGKVKANLPEMDSFNQKPVYIDVFNRGNQYFDYEVTANKTWLKITPDHGSVDQETRIWLSADWTKVPVGEHLVLIKIQQVGGKEISINVKVNNPSTTEFKSFTGFIESNNFVSIEAEHFSRNIEANETGWKVIPGLGRTLSAVSVFPVTAPVQVPGGKSPHLEYDLYLYHSGEVKVNLYLSPSLNYFNDEGLKIAVSFDDKEPQILAFNKDDKQGKWDKWVSENCIKVVSGHQLKKSGKHTLKVWVVTPGVVLEKIVVQTGGEKRSYLGEPESTILN
ncbi:MAG: glycosyl hydrolase 115 family protein [Prolixibacteraceae bacterium]